MVFPDGAGFVAETRTHEGYGSPYDRSSSTGSVVGDIVDSVLDSLGDEDEDIRGYRISESTISVGQPVYVLGTVSRAGDVASIGRGEGPFIISHKMEEELTRKYKLNYILEYVFSAILAAGGIAAAIYALAGM